MKVLLALPDGGACSALGLDLRSHGLTAVACLDGFQALWRWRAESPAMVLLHADLPGIDGYGVCRAIRDESRAPIVMVSPRLDDDSVARGFEAGADDCVASSTSQRQLIARLVAILRRPFGALADDPALARETVRTATLSLDVDSHEVTRGRLTSRLSPSEFGLLHLLAANEGRLVATPRLMPGPGGRGGRSRDTVRSRVASVRRKLGMRAGDPDDIRPIRGRGYLLQRPTSRPLDPE